MLPTDMELIWDKKFKPYVEQYAKDEDKFFEVKLFNTCKGTAFVIESGTSAWQLLGNMRPPDILEPCICSNNSLLRFGSGCTGLRQGFLHAARARRSLPGRRPGSRMSGPH